LRGTTLATSRSSTTTPARRHSFPHKGYWWRGAAREAETMAAFRRVLRPGDTVVEVGAHIGYIALFFSHLVSARGQAITFEPGENNLPYVRTNVAKCPNVRLVEKAVGDHAATMKLNIENFAGQNTTPPTSR
jgi:predicted methyltransferase